MPENPASDDVAEWLRTHLRDDEGETIGAGYQASISRVRAPFGDVVVKRPHSGLLGFVARASIAHEHRVYGQLQGVPGIAKCYGLIEDKYLVLEHISGLSLREHAGLLHRDEGFLDKLLETIKAMHAAGVAHGDLKRKNNILVGPNDAPYVVDFGVACRLRERGGFMNRFWFDYLKQTDYNAWIKLKYGRPPIGISPEDSKLYRQQRIERTFRGLRVAWQTLTLRNLRRRRKRRGESG